MNTVTISDTFEVVIPPEIRRQFDLRPGQQLAFVVEGRTLRVIIGGIDAARGRYAGIDTDPQREKIDRDL
jgi:AbrB family looped-hinge helix DNA binding protein